jgi:hypothetical protein
MEQRRQNREAGQAGGTQVGTPPAASAISPLFRYLVIDGDGRRVGRFESGRLDWTPGDVFSLDADRLRIVEILPEVSTMTTYNAVWVAAPA